MNYVQGDNQNQVTMFSPILDDYVDENNPVRVVDAFVDRYMRLKPKDAEKSVDKHNKIT